MKSKKGLIILSSVVVVCAAALVISPIINWPIDTSKSGGNISKSSRFSRKTASEGISNMEELILNDPTYKNGIVAAYMVMQTRAQQFSALVDMSNEVAGDIPEFADVLDEMNKTYVTVNNVCASLLRAGENINATLNGEQRPDLAQNTINASLAYTTLQKQNKLATSFIDVTDKYLQTAEGTDRLKFVRDQWVDYQRMTAALDGDEKAAQALEKKGTLLSAEKTVASLGSFSIAQQITIMESANVAQNMAVTNSVVNSVPVAVVSNVFEAVGNAITVSNTQGSVSNANTVNQQIVASLASNTSVDFVKSMGWDNIGSQQVVSSQQIGNQQVVSSQQIASQQVGSQQVVASQQIASQQVGSQQVVSSQQIASQQVGNQQVVSNQMVSNQIVANMTELVGSFGTICNTINSAPVDNLGNTNPLCGQVSNIIGNTAVGSVPALQTN